MKNLATLLLLTFYSLNIFSQNIELKNVNWFDGNAFNKSNLYIVKGKFSINKPNTINEVINLDNKYIIPPFGEAHTHNLASDYDAESMIDKYIKEGTFYINVLGGSHKGREAVEKRISNSILEVKYSNGGITCTLGHPFTIYEPLAMGIHNPVEKRKRAEEIGNSRLAENDAYWFFDTIDEVDEKWERLMQTKPDIIKIMILNVNNYDSLYNNKKMLGGKGISKKVASYVVKKSKQDSLRVYAHIETAKDFNFAVEIGVDVITHIPGYAWKGDPDTLNQYLLTQDDIKEAAAKNIAVITTTSLAMNYLKEYKDGKPMISKEKLTRVTQYQKDLLKAFKSNELSVAIGSDQYAKTLFTEVDYLNDNDILDKKAILNIICKTNPQLVFPNRKIGEIKNSYEASFLVLDGNPLYDFKYLKSINSKYKEGVLIN